MDSNGFSLESIVQLRAEAFAHVRHHNAMVLTIATGIEALDAAYMSSTERNLGEWQSLVAAAGRLAALLDSEGQR